MIMGLMHFSVGEPMAVAFPVETRLHDLQNKVGTFIPGRKGYLKITAIEITKVQYDAEKRN